MMMQISSTIPAHNLHMSQARRASFKCQVSPLNPTAMPASSSTDATRLHLANLDKLLQKNPPPPITFQPQPQPNTNEVQNEKKPKTVLEGLNLARLWPEIKATEEMSPRHMNRLQRLLSMTPEYSPRNILGSRWREFHGSNDWKGMLDPLDENLRREVVRYGEFVQAAYHCFHSNPATSPEEPPIPRHVVLSDRSYRVTKSLYATSSIGLPKWVDDVAPDLGWMTQRSSWVGYVAVCDDRREINRMGRRDIVIALRGTATCLEWAENMRAQLSDMDESHQTDNRPQVECGFLSLYKTQGAHVASLAESVKEEVKRLMEMYKGETLSITVTGHSLGAALALLVAEDVSSEEEMPPVAVFSFGGPRVGNREFGDRIAGKKVKVLRIVNSQDVITNVPLGAYSHVGSELRLDIKSSPYLRPDADMACCHDLEAYLHLVDGFLASNCPFRTNAKRSLARLMQDQGSNVKKLYSSKAKALSVNIERQGSFSMSNIQRQGSFSMSNIQRQGSFSMSTCLPSPS